MAHKAPITCHVLDTQFGKPAGNVPVQLHKWNDNQDTFSILAEGATDSDGRCTTLLPPGELEAATYKMTFKTQLYFDQSNRESFFPIVEIVFSLKHPEQHYHIPLLLSPFSYTTYRGS